VVLQYICAMDRIDRMILQQLSTEGRLSNIELAERVGLSPSACLRRVQELERSGVITGYRARIDPAKLGITFMAYVTPHQGGAAGVRSGDGGRARGARMP
jgi:Lrp/AsnC family transcriptional regulator, leucine-responsive regulatory protein